MHRRHGSGAGALFDTVIAGPAFLFVARTAEQGSTSVATAEPPEIGSPHVWIFG